MFISLPSSLDSPHDLGVGVRHRLDPVFDGLEHGNLLWTQEQISEAAVDDDSVGLWIVGVLVGMVVLLQVVPETVEDGPVRQWRFRGKPATGLDHANVRMFFWDSAKSW